jgi:hypothetical protein
MHRSSNARHQVRHLLTRAAPIEHTPAFRRHRAEHRCPTTTRIVHSCARSISSRSRKQVTSASAGCGQCRQAARDRGMALAEICRQMNSPPSRLSRSLHRKSIRGRMTPTEAWPLICFTTCDAITRGRSRRRAPICRLKPTAHLGRFLEPVGTARSCHVRRCYRPGPPMLGSRPSIWFWLPHRVSHGVYTR